VSASRLKDVVLDLVPFNRLGPVRFGESPENVAEILGPPANTRVTKKGEVEEERDLIRISYAGEEAPRVVEVSVIPPAEVAVGGRVIRWDFETLDWLLSLESKPMELVGFLLLPQLGIAITGLHDQDPSQRAITAFQEGRWDHLRPEMKPFVIHRF
jgi:hypothetical protein